MWPFEPILLQRYFWRACSPFSDFDVFRFCHNNQQRNLSNIFKPSIISNISKKLSNISDAHPFFDKAITKSGVWFWYDYNNHTLARKNTNKLTCCSAAATWKVYKFLIYRRFVYYYTNHYAYITSLYIMRVGRKKNRI